MKIAAQEFFTRGIDSLTLSIELFNRPYDRGRADGSLIFAHHAFEQLLKAILVNGDKNILSGDKTWGFEKCVNVINSDLKLINADERKSLLALDSWRDTSYHYHQRFSEDLLYTVMQTSVSLFSKLARKALKCEMSDFLPDRVLPICINPPKDLIWVIKNQLAVVDTLLKQKGKTQAASSLRSVLPLLEMSAEDEKRYSEQEVLQVLDARTTKKSWNKIFPQLPKLEYTKHDGDIGISFSIKKDGGIPVTLVKDSNTSLDDSAPVIVQSTDWFDKYSLSADDVAKKVGLTRPKLLACVEKLGLKQDPSCYGEKNIKSQTYVRYTAKAVLNIKEFLKMNDVNVIWQQHKSKNQKTKKAS